MLIVLGDLESIKIAAEAEQAIIVINKCDSTRSSDLNNLLECTKLELNKHFPEKYPPIVSISCRDAEKSDGNIGNLLDILQTTFGTMTSVADEELDLLGVSQRQSQLLSSCTEHLGRFKDETLQGDECDIVVAAEHLRAAATCLARITGRGEAGDVEEVLGVVFEKYVPHCPCTCGTMLTVTDSASENEAKCGKKRLYCVKKINHTQNRAEMPINQPVVVWKRYSIPMPLKKSNLSDAIRTQTMQQILQPNAAK